MFYENHKNFNFKNISFFSKFVKKKNLLSGIIEKQSQFLFTNVFK